MPRNIQTLLCRCVLLASTGSIAIAQSPAQQGATQGGAASKPELVYRIAPLFENGGLRQLEVEMTFNGDADGKTILALPNLNGIKDDHWQTFSDFAAKNADLRSTTEKSVELTHAPGAPITLTYRVAEKFPDGWTTQIEPTRFSTLGWALFLRIADRQPRATVAWGRWPSEWQIASDLQHSAPNGFTPQQIAFSTIVGGPGIAIPRAEVGGRLLRVAIPTDFTMKPAEFVPFVASAAELGNAMFGDPGTDFLVTVTSGPGYNWQGGANLADSFALYLPTRLDKDELRNTIVHEYLHNWIAGRMGGGRRWFSEGFTEYFSRAMNLRTGAYSPEVFVARWNKVLARYAGSSFRTQPDSVTNARFFESSETEAIGEDRGSMVAALLEYRLRRGTSGRIGLTDVLRKIKSDLDAGRGDGQGQDRMVKAAREIAGVDLASDIDRYLGRGEDLLLPDDLFGTCAAIQTIEVPTYNLGFAPMRIGGVFKNVDPAGPAFAAGIRDGMTLVARENGFADDPRPELAGLKGDPRTVLIYRVRQNGQERVIRYKPAGPGKMKMQEIVLRRNMTPGKRATCVRQMSGAEAAA